MECGIRHSVLLLTGSNFRGKEQILQRAAECIAEQVGPIERASQICYSEAWGFTCEEEFANQAILVSTVLAANEVLMKTQAIERELGRDREAESEEKLLTGERYASRVVDIDIIFYDDIVVESEKLTLPHPLMHEREFVLRPMLEVAAEWRHPIIGLTTEEMIERVGRIQN
jgi:2-amino-4-hydroxy-6-hydroxymethyldihydropteridine diphosphokinase